jgi:hypothetical protein
LPDARVVEVLYVAGCPHYDALLVRLRSLIDDSGVPARVELRRIPDDAAAVRERFLGSPTVRVDGHDVEPGASERRDFGICCRLYGEHPSASVPRDEWILDALGVAGP